MKENEKFADELDRASYLEAEAIKAAIEAARSSNDGIEAQENCNYCGEHLNQKRKFCDDECAESFELMRKRKKQNVKVY